MTDPQWFGSLAAACILLGYWLITNYDIKRRQVDRANEQLVEGLRKQLGELHRYIEQHGGQLVNIELRLDSHSKGLEFGRDRQLAADSALHEALKAVEAVKSDSATSVAKQLVELRDWSAGEFAAMKTAFDRFSARDAVANATVHDARGGARQFG